MKREYQLDFKNKKDIEAVLDDLLKLTSKVKVFEKLFADDEDAMAYEFDWIFGQGNPAGVAYNSEEFIFDNSDLKAEKTIGCWMSDGVYHFFQQALSFGLEDKIVILIKNIDSLQKTLRYNVWSNDETLLGSEPAFLLAMHDKKYITLYVGFLKSIKVNTLDHEIQHASSVEPLLEKYGYCPETVNYLVTIGSRTQMGQESLSMACRSKELAEYITATNDYNDFIEAIEAGYRGAEPQMDKETIGEFIGEYISLLRKNIMPDEAE